MRTKISKEKAIRIFLHQQHLYHEPHLHGKQGIIRIVNDLGAIQIDSMSVVTKSHNLVFFARLKEYKESDLIDLYNEGKVFEAYVHAMSLLPTNRFQYVYPGLHAFKEKMFIKCKKDEIDYLLSVYHTVVSSGPLTTKEISSKFYQSSGVLETWEMSPVRSALDRLWRSGLIHVRRDKKFNKIYYNELVSTKDQNENLSEDEVHTFYCLHALKAMGVATEKDVADYYRIPIHSARRTLNKLLKEKKIHELEVERLGEQYYMLIEDEPLLYDEMLTEEPTHSCFLSPFDNFIWFRSRLMNLFEVDYRLESYIPKNKRKYGYYAMPILVKGKIIGTIDFKLGRKENTLYLQNLFLYNPFDADCFKTELYHLIERYAFILEAKQIQVSTDCLEKNSTSPSVEKFIRNI